MANISTCNDVARIVDRQLSGLTQGLYDNLENGDNTFEVNEVINRFCRTALTTDSRSNSRFINPKDPNCTHVEYEIKYEKPECSPAARDCADVQFGCAPAPAVSYDCGIDRPVMDYCVADHFTISPAQFCTADNNMTAVARRAMEKLARNLYYDYSIKNIEAIAALPGAFKGETDSSLIAPRDLKLFNNGADGSMYPQPQGFGSVVKQYRKIFPKTTQEPVIITGSDLFSQLTYSMPIFAGNTDGKDASRVRGFSNMFYDPQFARHMETLGAFTSESAISFMPQNIHLLEHYLFDTDQYSHLPNGRISYSPISTGMTKNTELSRQVVDLSPFLGFVDNSNPFLVDLEIFHDSCTIVGGDLTFRAKKHWGLWTPPADVFCDASNGILAWNLTCDSPFACSDATC